MLSQDLQAQLAQHNITDYGEVALREALETHIETYTLIRLAPSRHGTKPTPERLAPWPARRWQCHYRLMMGGHIYAAQSAAEAYAMGLLAALISPPQAKNP